MLTSLGPLALAVVTSALAADAPAQLPSRAIEQRLSRQLLLAAIAPESPPTASPDPFDVPPSWNEKSALQLHDEGQVLRVVLGGPLAVGSMVVATGVVGLLAAGVGFSGDLTAGGAFVLMGLGATLIPMAGAGAMVLVGEPLGGRGTFTTPWLAGLGGGVLALAGTWAVNTWVGPNAGYLTGIVAIPVLLTGGVVVGYELSSEDAARARDRRFGRGTPVAIVPVIAPTKDGAIGGLAVAF